MQAEILIIKTVRNKCFEKEKDLLKGLESEGKTETTPDRRKTEEINRSQLCIA